LATNPSSKIKLTSFAFPAASLKTPSSVTTDFGVDFGYNPEEYSYTVVIQIDGKIIVSGGAVNFEVARYNSNGSPDNSFDGDGKLLTAITGYATYAHAYGAVLFNNTLYVVGGIASSSGGAMVAYKLDNTVSSGLSYKYYEGEWNTLPAFNTLVPVKTGTSANVDISARPAAKDDHFAFVWEGKINIQTPGDYTFETVSDDGSKFYFNTFYSSAAIPLVNNDGIHAAKSAMGSLFISSAGLYPVTITYFEKDGGETMQLFYTGPGITRQLVPDAVLSPRTVDINTPTSPLNLHLAYKGRRFARLYW